ncbi:hypothetical protein C6502_01865 [Candidatus Poribacteria bacterium]|nr:MAG: hypothetical protein C6502_01865 [Candidatus Poribacteria bacterium]
MKTKQLLVLIGVLVVLGLLVLILENPFGKSEEQKKVEEAGLLFPYFNKENVAKIEVIAPFGLTTTTLVKQNSQWLVESMDNYPADQTAVEELLDKVAEMKTIQRASNNPEKQSVFEVDSSGVEAKLTDTGGNLLAHLFAGKTTPEIFNSYVRAADSNDVYIVKGYLKATFDKGYRSWRDRTIFAFLKEDVTHLTIRSEEEEVELQIDAAGAWQMLKPIVSAADRTEVEAITELMGSLETDDFVESKPLSEYGLDAPKMSIAATLKDGSARTLLIGNEESGAYYVKHGDKAQIFELNKGQVDKLIKKSADLKADTAVSESDGEGTSVKIGEGGGE